MIFLQSTHTTVRYTQIEETHIYELVANNTLQLKIDFAKYPYKRLEKGQIYHGITVDSMIDIGANKVATVNSRNEVKDFVDLYFLLKHVTIWDLLRAYEQKFSMEIDLILFASNVLKVEEYTFLPKMNVELSLHELQDYFLTLADKIGKRIAE